MRVFIVLLNHNRFLINKTRARSVRAFIYIDVRNERIYLVGATLVESDFFIPLSYIYLRRT